MVLAFSGSGPCALLGPLVATGWRQGFRGHGGGAGETVVTALDGEEPCASRHLASPVVLALGPAAVEVRIPAEAAFSSANAPNRQQRCRTPGQAGWLGEAEYRIDQHCKHTRQTRRMGKKGQRPFRLAATAAPGGTADRGPARAAPPHAVELALDRQHRTNSAADRRPWACSICCAQMLVRARISQKVWAWPAAVTEDQVTSLAAGHSDRGRCLSRIPTGTDASSAGWKHLGSRDVTVSRSRPGVQAGQWQSHRREERT